MKLGIPGVSATIVFRDGTIWTGVSGLADVAARTKVTPDTAFAYASVSKTFTSALILQLIGEGRLRLTDSAARLLPAIRLKDVSVVERSPMTEGRTLFMILTKGKTPQATRPAAEPERTPVAT